MDVKKVDLNLPPRPPSSPAVGKLHQVQTISNFERDIHVLCKHCDPNYVERTHRLFVEGGGGIQLSDYDEIIIVVTHT